MARYLQEVLMLLTQQQLVEQSIELRCIATMFCLEEINMITPLLYRWCGLCKHRSLHAHWTAQSEFSELVLGENMVKHHMPGTVLKALLTLQTQENTLTTA